MTSDTWDTMAGLLIQCKYRHAARDCVQHALQAYEPSGIKARAPLWRKLISYTEEQQMLGAYAQVQRWVSQRLGERGGEARTACSR